MKRYSSFAGIFILQFLFISAAAAQSKTKANTLQPPPADIKIDGSLKEWGDSLRYYNPEKKLYYTLANDKDNVYMAIRINDREEQARILGAGLTLGINTKGKKSNTYTITFPVVEHKDGGAAWMGAHRTNTDITQADRDELMRERLTKLRDIKVSGFKDIEGDMITTTNTYGIKTAIDYDDNGYLIYEAAIPLKLFGAFKADKDEWSFNFKINGLPKPGENGSTYHGGMGEGGGSYGGGRGGRGGGMGGGGRGSRGGGYGGSHSGENMATDHSELYKSIDFWEKYYLGM